MGLASLSPPEDLAKNQSCKSAHGIRRRIPNVRGTGVIEPILPTLVGNAKAGAKGKESPGESVCPPTKSGPSQYAHDRILDEVENLVRNHLRSVRHIAWAHAGQIQNHPTVSHQCNSPLHHADRLALYPVFSQLKTTFPISSYNRFWQDLRTWERESKHRKSLKAVAR